MGVLISWIAQLVDTLRGFQMMCDALGLHPALDSHV